MEHIPKPVIVIFVLILASLGFYFADPPHSPCQSQIEIIKEKLKGRLFPGKGKKNPIPGAYASQLENCKLSNTPGGCYELFGTMRLFVRETGNLSFECNEYLGDVDEFKKPIQNVLALMIRIAWGESTPQQGESTRQWLEPSDVSLFCHIKDLYIRFLGKESLDEFQKGIFASLPGEAPQFDNGKCTNCENRKNALQTNSLEEVWARSLMSTRCDQFR